MSRHHIIPFSTLRNFYNNLVNNGEVTSLHRRFSSRTSFLERLADRIPTYYEGAGRDCDVDQNWSDITSIINFIFSIGYKLINQTPSPALRPGGFDNFVSIYSWLPGNLFIGPRNRSDDPGENFERHARVIVGNDRADNLEEIYRLMTDYNQGRPIDFGDLSTRLQRVTNIRQPFALRASNWARNPITGTYFINTHPDPLKATNNEYIKSTSLLDDEACDELATIYNKLERRYLAAIMVVLFN